MKKIFKRFAKQTIANVRSELARAHLIIAMLSIAIIMLISLGMAQSVTFDGLQSSICVILLSIVTIISICMSICLFKYKK